MLINTSQQKRAFWETWVLLTGLIMWIGHRKEIQKLIFRALALPGANQGVMGCVWFIYRNMEIRYRLVPGNVKNNWINKLNEKRSLMPLGLRLPIWKINFCYRVLRLFVFLWWRNTPQTAICCLEWLAGEIKVPRDRLRCVFVVFLYITKVFSESVT